MSLSDDIINDKDAKAIAAIESGMNINYIDEYGFTPLIQAALCNKPKIAMLLLQHGAQVDAVDISGQTALHWAIDNNNYELTQALLDYKASPNSYTSHGQPALFNPILRNKGDLKNLLLSHGADMNFAQDYINAKLIGHRFELQGLSDIVNPDGVFLPIDLEGFFLEFTVGLIRESLEQFKNSFVANRLALPTQELNLISSMMNNAFELRKYKHYNIDVEQHLDEIRARLNHELLLLPVSFEGHAITFAKHKNMFAKCDRGVSKMTAPIVIHRSKQLQAFDFDFYKYLLYDKKSRAEIEQGLPLRLALRPMVKIPIRHQITGNCSWANVEASVPTMLFMLLTHDEPTQATVKQTIREVMKFYVVWKEWDKDRALENCMRGFDDMNPKRRKAKASLLGAVLFQACNFTKTRDVKRARKIMDILIRPEYHFVLRSYVTVFLKSGKGKGRARAFHKLLDALGVPISTFG